MQKHPGNSGTIEEEISRLGFDLSSIMKNRSNPRDDYFEVKCMFRLNEVIHQDQVLIEFGFECENGKPTSIRLINVTLVKQIGFLHFHIDKGLPTKDEIFNWVNRLFQTYETKEQDRIAKLISSEPQSVAKTVFLKMNGENENNSTGLNKKL